MSPFRLLGILFMVTILVGMFAVIGFSMFGFRRSMSHAFHHDSGLPIKDSHTPLTQGYKSVTVSGPIDFEWVRDAKPGFDVSGTQELVDRFRYEVKGDSIDFHLKSGFSFGGHIKVVL